MKNILDRKIIEGRAKKHYPQAKQIHSRLGIGSSIGSYAFILTCLELIYGKLPSQKILEEIITDGEKDEAIDTFYRMKGGRVDIFDFKNSYKCTKKDLQNFELSLLNNVFKKPIDYSIFNKQLEKVLKNFHKTKIEEINIYVIRGKHTAKQSNSYLRKMEQNFKKANSCFRELFFFNQTELINKILEPENYLPEWALKIASEEVVYEKNPVDGSNRYSELMIKLPLTQLIELYKQNKKLGLNLFNKNVRTFLNKQELSTKITETINNNPENFHIFHNGITITVSSSIRKDRGKYYIKNPQVVNGVQTVNTIFNWYEKTNDLKKIKKAAVFCKIIKADNKLTEKICEASNTQTKIESYDLRSNDDLQKKIEFFLDAYGKYCYIRKRGDKARKGEIKILFPEFWQWTYSTLFEKPADAKNKKKQLFDIVSDNNIYEKIYSKLNSGNASTVNKICDIGIYVKNRINLHKNKDKKRFLKYANLHIMAGLYFLNTQKKNYDKNFDQIFKVLKKYCSKEINQNPDTTLNQIFTKSDKIWLYLKKVVSI